MNIVIKSYLAASDLLQKEPQKWHSIFILDSNLSLNPKAEELAFKSIALHFDDIETEVHGKVLPSANAVKKAINFSHDATSLLVSCRAGQSRSAAMAYLMGAHYNGCESAIEILDPNRHRPNQQLIELGCPLVNDPSAYLTIKRWREQLTGKINIPLFEKEVANLVKVGIANIITSQP